MQPQVTGPEVARFISQHFSQDISQRPELEMGFCALRRRENVKLAQLYGLPIDENLRGERIARLMEAWWMEGRFPPPPKPEDKIADLEAKVAELTALIGDKPDIVNDNPQGITTTAEIGPEDPREMTWTELQKYASGQGIQVHGRKRDEIESDLKAL